MKAVTLRTFRAALIPGLVVGLAAGALVFPRSGATEQAELFLWDVRAARAARSNPASPGIVMVAVDDATVRLAGGTYPVPRSAMAAVISEARRAGARAIAVDFILEDPLEGSLADENAALEEAIAAGGVILAPAASFWQAVTALGLTITPLLAKLGRAVARRAGISRVARGRCWGSMRRARTRL